ncbi:MAG: ABC-three component system protein [Aliiglaciecola sp.]|uniref:ABC-three component system protein n=1 Tax=Aliiglaciecola sp. TaxID=1872441 RepID=UPI003298754B
MSKRLRRANVTDTVKMSLLCEVKGFCPLCRCSLMGKKISGDNIRLFDVAHIYPLNATPSELILLKNERRLSSNIDCEENFIPLCKPCHKKYDTNKTVLEYRQLYKIKVEIRKLKELSEQWSAQVLHEDIARVADVINNMAANKNSSTKLSLDALTLEEKKNDTLGVLNEIKVSHFITQFYIPIKQSFFRLEQEERARSQFIYSQVKSYYLLLLSKNFNQADIFEQMCEWFMTSQAIKERAKAEVLVSYFIQNCEVLS